MKQSKDTEYVVVIYDNPCGIPSVVGPISHAEAIDLYHDKWYEECHIYTKEEWEVIRKRR